MFDHTFVVFFRLLIAVAAVKADIVSFEASKNAFTQGDQIVLTCTLGKQIPFGAVFHIDKTYGNATKRFDFEDPDVEPRFNLSTDVSGDYGRVILTIQNAVPGDSGNYSCAYYLNHNTAYRFLNVTVEDEPDTIRFFLNDNEISNGSQSTMLKPNNAYRLRCKTGGSNPQANISISYGGVILTPTNVSNSSAILRYDHQGDFPFVIPIEYNTTTTVDHWVFTADALSTPLICLAKVNMNATGISAIFYPQIEEGAPLFACNDTVNVQIIQPNFPISCVVYSRPTLNRASIFFNTGKANLSINGYPWGTERTADDQNYRGIVKVVNDISFIMTLTIGVIDPTAKLKFNFEAGNDRGTTIHSVDLVYKGKTSLASSVKPMMTVLFVSATFVSAFLCRP